MRSIAVLIFLIVWLAISGLVASVLPGDAGMIAVILLNAVNSFLCVVVHELGHAAIAHLYGAKITTIVAFPFELRLNPQIKLRTKAKTGRGDLGGYVAYRLDTIEARKKHVLIAAGGPLANIVLGVMVALAATAMPTGGIGYAILLSIALLSFGMALANMIPFEGSDGKAIFRGILAGVRNRSK